MKVESTKLNGVAIITPEIFEDHRGEFVQTYSKKMFHENDIDLDFVQDDISVSYKDVLRGIHGDTITWKLVTCLYGRLYCVVVNCDEQSKYFGDWLGFTLTDKNRKQILVPPNYGLSYLTLSDMVIFGYKQTTEFEYGKQFSYRYNHFDINWPINKPILSDRDLRGNYVTK